LVYADDFPSDSYRLTIRPVVAREVAQGEYRLVCRFGDVAAYRRKDRK